MFLLFEDMAQTARVPLRHCATMLVLVFSGLGMIGIAHMVGLRLHYKRLPTRLARFAAPFYRVADLTR
jgi:hypothetical protein